MTAAEMASTRANDFLVFGEDRRKRERNDFAKGAIEVGGSPVPEVTGARTIIP